MKNIVGIDLGTTMSVISKLHDRGKPEIIPNSEGERLTPSVVIFSDYENKILVGLDAKNSFPASVNKKRGARDFKRKMIDIDYSIKIDGKKYTAPELSSIVLKKLVQDASKEIGEIKDVVISVPAYFREVGRNATMEAGRLAGLNVINIINEPTAAALYYVTNNNINGKVLVYDLGGGTFDVTILNAHGTNIEVLSSEGDHKLGGIDFDNALLEIFSDKYKIETDEDLYTTKEDEEELLLQAERTKKKLSKSKLVKERLVGEGGRAVIEITVEEFEEKISTYISRTELLVEQVFDSAGIEFDEIDEILLVGGSTRIPLVSRSIEETIGKKPVTTVNVDEAVALGAAIQAGLVLSRKSPEAIVPSVIEELKGINLKDVTNHSYGTISMSYDEILGKRMFINTIILKKNTPLPCENRETFYTLSDGQTKVDISITQGEDEDPEFVDTVKKDFLELPIGRSKGQPLEFTYSYDENGIMNCKIQDLNSGRVKEVRLDVKEIINSNKINDFEIR